MHLINPQRPRHHEAQCQADGYAEYHTKSEQAAGHPLPHIYIHHDGERVHVHVMHHDAEPEHHTHDFGDPAIFAHIDEHYGAGQRRPE
jgi:hypothetical protein